MAALATLAFIVAELLPWLARKSTREHKDDVVLLAWTNTAQVVLVGLAAV